MKTAKSEINEKTDIWVEYKKIKEGRSITKIKFSIETKITNELMEQTLHAKDIQLKDMQFLSAPTEKKKGFFGWLRR